MTGVFHQISPVYDAQSKVLILGTIPSPKSRETGFYYGHPQNRFWRVLADVFSEVLPVANEEKTAFLLEHNIALWDVLQFCEINGADDSSIKKPVVNNISLITNTADIRAVFTTGKKAEGLYRKYCLKQTGIEPIYLPSTSPANCGVPYEKLLSEYKTILNYLDGRR